MTNKLTHRTRTILKRYLSMTNEEIIASARIAFKGLKPKKRSCTEKFDDAMKIV